ncbi:glycyl-tRNA synthetase subunit beta [Thermincola ferriacetica]|uniref:Glycine--tRNA ligase beta subunit n=1 Tax=Thermincola ferriacetica TaxID=281456 RepID=A0A0L6VYK3_9FIRM|nr:glycine--tRNA ligase subunit beta [Thermincola ferriacetica]KNZ68243.1 glycyl-tRNA synthetase subunit beta [Thermincola ferriacetica]
MAKDFLLEIGTEEIPARFMDDALMQLGAITGELIKEYRFKTPDEKGAVQVYGTPRRLVVSISNLGETQESAESEAKGPSVKAAYDEQGQPTKAALGFARSQGVAVEDLVVKNTGAGEYVFAVKREEGRNVAELLPEFCLQLINGLSFPKPMRWADHEMRFVRPIRWILALYGEDVINFQVAGTVSGRTTKGHRFLGKGEAEIANPADYFRRIEKELFVVIDPEERKRRITREVEALTKQAGGYFKEDDDFRELLDEVVHLVEYPVALTGSFEPDFLKLPKEVVVTPMREHQRYFPVEKEDGQLLDKFIAISNGINNDLVREGNEKVLRARLADAKFFYDEDLKVPLAENVDKLKKIVFQESLGTVYDKVERIIKLGTYLAEALQIDGAVQETIKRAGYLCKADLVSNMVYEFPELQGVMGKDYARHSGETDAVAEAIFEHYLPRFAGDILPEAKAGQILSIADKMDTVVGCFAVGIQPTGSQDPYALRRQALGICHVILNSGLRVSLSALVKRAYDNYEGKIEAKLNKEETVAEVLEFFRQRIKNILENKAISYDVIEAVLASGYDDLIDTVNRAEALTNLRNQEIFDKLLRAYNRVANLANKAETEDIEPALLKEEAEKALYKEFLTASEEFRTYLKEGQYRQLFQRFALLQQPIDNYFEQVMVMVDDERIKNNRLALLKQITNLMLPIADLTKIVQ